MTKSNNKILSAFLGAFFVIVGYIIFYFVDNKNKYVMYYAKQGLVIGILGVVISILKVIPVIGGFLFNIGGLFFFILWIVSWINALSNKKRPILILGDVSKKI